MIKHLPPGISRPALGTRALFALSAMLVAGWLIARLPGDLTWALLWSGLRNLTALQSFWAILLTAISFWAVGKYDGAIHKVIGTGITEKDAAASGRIAIALSQTLGFGLVTGTLIRWNWFRGHLSAVQAGKVTAAVALAFLVGAMVLASFLAPMTDIAAFRAAPVVGAIVLLVLIAASFRRSRPGAGRFSAPPLKLIVALAVWTTVDIIAAGLAFWSLLPEPQISSLLPVVAAFAITLPIALLSGAPGGVGVFEAAMLMLLGKFVPADVIAACAAFRAVYYAGPALLAVLFLARGRKGFNATVPDPAGPAPGKPLPEAEPAGRNYWHGPVGDEIRSDVARLPQSLVGLSIPVSHEARDSSEAALVALARRAHAQGRAAALYKCDARSAASARALGWCAVRLARDAILDPMRFETNGRPKRQLRRKLRQAEASGLWAECAMGTLPLSQIAQVDRLWSGTIGTARGFSMSRPGEADLSNQMVFLVWRGTQLQGYCSFHMAPDCWTLDLMPFRPTAPNGAAHLAIITAIEAARLREIGRLSLAAVPAIGRSPHLAPLKWLISNHGLDRFKASFEPRWAPRYITAPGVVDLVLASLDIVLAICRPGPASALSNQPHEKHETCAFAS